jgi:hypothetical protein
MPPKKPTRESPEDVVDRVCDTVLKNNLFLLLEDMELTEKSLHVVLGLHRHPAFHDRVVHHPIISEPTEALTRALQAEFPDLKVSVELFPIDVDAKAFHLYLRQAGPRGAELLAAFKKELNPPV